MIDVMSLLHALGTIHIPEHIDGLVATGTIVGLLIARELCGSLNLLYSIEKIICLT
jgi:hypothetical protein